MVAAEAVVTAAVAVAESAVAELEEPAEEELEAPVAAGRAALVELEERVARAGPEAKVAPVEPEAPARAAVCPSTRQITIKHGISFRHFLPQLAPISRSCINWRAARAASPFSIPTT